MPAHLFRETGISYSNLSRILNEFCNRKILRKYRINGKYFYIPTQKFSVIYDKVQFSFQKRNKNQIKTD
jgi:hypothetical protein